ncbi:insulinase family protein [soil metagenome]
MSRRIGFALTVVVSICVLSGRAPARAAEPLPSDPANVTGELDNGMKYIVRKHSVPPGRAVMWIHLHTGALNETDAQRGIAHYLEHMAFNGSENFKPGTLVPFFQSMGMTFGRDQNAFTSFDQTTYQLSLPNCEPETLGKGMTFFADVVSRLSLLPSEVDAERQIILEERRRGLSGRQRTSTYVMERLTPGSLFGFRLPIGTEETIKGVKEQDFRDYYGKWYTPSNTTLIVIADTDPEKVIEVIKKEFGDEPKKPRPVRQELGVKAYDHNFAIVASDPELRSAEIRIEKNRPADPPTTTVEQYRADTVLRLGQSAMNRRLRELAMGGNQPYLNASVSAGDEANAIHSTSTSATARPDKWKPALEAVALELQRARAFGFTDRELNKIRKDLLTNAERAVETADTTPAQAIIRSINNSIATGDTIMSPEQRLEMLKKLLPTITSEEVARRFSDDFDPKNVAFVAVLPTGADVPTEGELLELGLKALDVAPTETPDNETTKDLAQLLNELPTPGTVAEGQEHAATQVWDGWLSNNARLHYKFMDQSKDEVSVSIQLIGGAMLETAENRGVTQAAQLAWSRAATTHYTSAEIREFMNGKKVNVGGGGGFGGGGRGRRGGGGGGLATGDSISLSIAGKPNELETGFQLAYLLLTEPKIEDAGFSQFMERTRQALQESFTNPATVATRLQTAAIYPDNEVRLKPLTIEQLDKLTADAAQAWLNRLIAESPIEVTIVGDLPKEKAIELATRYIGSLPSRPRVDPHLFADVRKVERPKGPRVFEKEIETPTPQAVVYSGFYGADESNRKDVRALSLAARILSTRMVKEVREQAQLVYSIGASSRAATTYPGFGVFAAGAPTDPHKVPALVEKLQSMYETFAKDGPTDDEVDVAKKQYVNNYTESTKEPAFWTGRLNQLAFRGVTLDELAKEPEEYASLTAEQVKEAFARYYSKDNSIVVVVKPKPEPTTKTAGAGE